MDCASDRICRELHRSLWRGGLVHRVGAEARVRPLRRLSNHPWSAGAGLGRGDDWALKSTFARRTQLATPDRFAYCRARRILVIIIRLWPRLSSAFGLRLARGRALPHDI